LFLLGSLELLATFVHHSLPENIMSSLNDPEEGGEMNFIKMADDERA